MRNLNLLCHMVLFILVLIGCKSSQYKASTPAPVATNIYIDERFSGYENIAIETEEEVFAINDEMKAVVNNKIKNERDEQKRAVRLLRYIFNTNDLNLIYSNNANLTAIETFNAKAANCMSLTIMAYVLAKEAGLNVRFQDVKVPEYWVRNGDYNMLTGHVNLVIVKRKDHNKAVVWGSELLQIDFDPTILRQSFSREVIEKNVVLAMFYNNKGAEALVNLNYVTAYAYFKKASQIAPQFSTTWGNLGILYRFIEEDNIAIDSYRHAIALNKENLTAMKNLSLVLHEKGELAEVNRINNYLYEKRIGNAYYHSLLGSEALHRGNAKLAISHYKRAIKINRKVHEFYFGLAKSYFKANEIVAAKKALRRAINLNKSKQIESQYVAKLNFIKEVQ